MMWAALVAIRRENIVAAGAARPTLADAGGAAGVCVVAGGDEDGIIFLIQMFR